MKECVVKKAKQILEELNEGHFETAKNWSPDLKEDFYLYFADSDSETRKFAILVFAAAVGNSRRGVARVVHSDKAIRDCAAFGDEDKSSSYAYSFEKYLNAFLRNKEAIKNDFPLLFKIILAELKLWHDEKSFEIIFSDVDKVLLDKVIVLIKDIQVRNADLNLDLDPMLKEIGWKA